jgi:hypothetical protein
MTNDKGRRWERPETFFGSAQDRGYFAQYSPSLINQPVLWLKVLHGRRNKSASITNGILAPRLAAALNARSGEHVSIHVPICHH